MAHLTSSYFSFALIGHWKTVLQYFVLILFQNSDRNNHNGTSKQAFSIEYD